MHKTDESSYSYKSTLKYGKHDQWHETNLDPPHPIPSHPTLPHLTCHSRLYHFWIKNAILWRTNRPNNQSINKSINQSIYILCTVYYTGIYTVYVSYVYSINQPAIRDQSCEMLNDKLTWSTTADITSWYACSPSTTLVPPLSFSSISWKSKTKNKKYKNQKSKKSKTNKNETRDENTKKDIKKDINKLKTKNRKERKRELQKIKVSYSGAEERWFFGEQKTKKRGSCIGERRFGKKFLKIKIKHCSGRYCSTRDRWYV